MRKDLATVFEQVSQLEKAGIVERAKRGARKALEVQPLVEKINIRVRAGG